jgi:tRNA U34 2-thiouridine synthase MnmA/TrmU
LISGGLDSALSTKLMVEQGIEVMAVNFVLPFAASPDTASRSARRVADSLGVDLQVIALGEEFLEVMRAPRHGYGSNVNPCIDCRIHQLRRAADLMADRGAGFVVTGEVVGQRPMSQRANTMRCIERQSGLEGYLLRPLSAKLLEPTVPEIEGWVDRERLLGISGRSRKELMELAERKGVTGYSPPAGGCLLTDPGFARRIRDLKDHHTFELHDIRLLTAGRHFRLPAGSKLMVGRNEKDNALIRSMARPQDRVLDTTDCPGPTALLRGKKAGEEEELAARVVARYSDGKEREWVAVQAAGPESAGVRRVRPMGPEAVERLMI